MPRSELVIALANIASKGEYKVNPQGAKHINAVFDAIASLINELEAEEAAAKESENDDSS